MHENVETRPERIELALTKGEALVIRPGDRVALQFAMALTSDDARRVTEAWEARMPGVPVVILANGAKIAGIHREGPEVDDGAANT